ncbi:MAG: hypothetical protein COA99_01700 [Moraxellaceae bacterium]|nr:MAG: hypothetical protein COA99_01700 [Moraxellaceae bacterium]
MKCLLIILTSIVLSFISNLVYAAAPSSPQKFYVSGAIGASQVLNLDNYGISLQGDVNTSTNNNLSFAATVSAGYKFDLGIKAEIGYLHLGEVSYVQEELQISSIIGLLGEEDILTEDNYETLLKPSGFTLGVGYDYPLDDSISLSGKFGVFIWDVATTYNTEAIDISANTFASSGASFSSNGSDLYYGLGLTYRASKKLQIFAEWTRYQFSTEFNTSGINISSTHSANFFAVGAKYSFDLFATKAPAKPKKIKKIKKLKKIEKTEEKPKQPSRLPSEDAETVKESIIEIEQKQDEKIDHEAVEKQPFYDEFDIEEFHVEVEAIEEYDVEGIDEAERVDIEVKEIEDEEPEVKRRKRRGSFKPIKCKDKKGSIFSMCH